MRCPYCGDRRTEVLRTVYCGRSTCRRAQLGRVVGKHPTARDAGAQFTHC